MDRANAALTWDQKDEARVQFEEYNTTPSKVMRAHQERSGPEMVETTATPPLRAYRNFKKGVTSATPLSPLAAAVVDVNSLRNYASTIVMPDKLEQFEHDRHYSVDMDYARCAASS